ncbi:eukaryotic translation initiation factor 4E transporter-like isoform X3 [Ostrea edulis]|uniref:eukaryotic translation initiation factor 4E transporter-like isoform X3 n=1 Tax=Ostrea edulis TaxID=37623 RepID=UPI0024AE9990|nr:eukaryotic translation initiation factor 4E transporter-like isoform X3 [Ostrea edulis]XP_056013340.1 eukaryotic translation initiation factor 4E transporter-like isoform X3 [Ostrea edulis]
MEMERTYYSDDNGRDTPKGSYEMPTRTDTPGPLPKYRYSRDKLMEISTSKLAQLKPTCLSKDHYTPEGLWDPERWFRSFDTSRGNSPLTVGDKKRPPELDREYINRRRPSDPKERLRDDKDGIVLSPQRRSFGTGCHVSSHVPLGRQISIPGQENGEKDRNARRIGSGRIQIDRDREREPAHQDRDFRAIRDRFDREDRRFDNRENRSYGRREFEDRQNFRERGHYNNRNRRDSYRSRDEEEPEWFTEGPTSQQDRIELHGFERHSNTPEKEEENWRQMNRREATTQESRTEVPPRKEAEANYRGESVVANVNDRNGSLETNEPSSPEESNHSDSINVQSPQSNSLFDFNEFFKLENLPGLASNDGASPTADVTGIQSRFSKWFSNNSRDNSRRSSINEDFGYLNDLLSGSKSPVIPSPPPPSANSVSRQSVFSTSANSTFQDKPQHLSYDFTSVQKTTIGPMLNALFQNTSHDRSHRSSNSSITAQDAEAQLKALLFGRKGSTPSSSGTGSPSVASPLNLPGRFKTVAELEADMKPPNHTFTPPGAPIQHPVISQPVRQKIAQPPPPAQSPKDQQDDLAAFNKLLSLMQAGAAAAVESPTKLPQIAARNLDQRSMSPVFSGQPPTPSSSMPPTGQPPLTPGSLAQNEFLQALLRNKEQQLQIRQQTLNHMRGSVHINNQSTPIAQPAQNFQQTPQTAGSTQPKLPNNSETLANFIKQNPTIITKPSTPTPPPQQPPQPLPTVPAVHSPLAPHPGQAAIMSLMQNAPSPRAASPQLIQQALLAQPGSPRVPSPIMFSQQPPMHLSAPSPIHPSQIAGKTSPVSVQAATNLSSTGTATIRPPVVPRVPSPQELIAHTQAIMQTALLKKQLEDQKERFMKKQQERGKSPNPPALPGKGALTGQQPCPASPRLGPSGTSPASSLPQSSTPQNTPISQSMPTSKQPSVTASFTPTSVIRKMHSDKASEKEKHRMDGTDGEKKVAPIKQFVMSEDPRGLQDEEALKQDHNVFDFRILTQQSQISQSTSHPPMSMGQNIVSPAASQTANNAHNQMPNLSIPPPSLANQSGPSSLVNQNSQPFSRNNSIDQVQHQMTAVDQIAAIQAMLAADRLKQTRQVMGTPSSVALQSAGRPIVKGVNVNSPLQQQNQTQLNKILSPQISNPNLVKADLQATPHRPIVGSGATPISSSGVELSKVLQQRHVISPNPMNRPSVGTPQGLPMGIPITGRLPLQPPVSVAHNPLLVQQMMQGNLSQTTVRVNSLGHLNQMAMQAQHHRMVDPRLQGIRGVYTPPASGVPPRGLTNTPMMNRTLAPGKQVLNGPISPNSNKSNDPNLLKWFGTDVLKTPLPHMPPLPTQGQRVMTVDEIERHTQAVSN